MSRSVIDHTNNTRYAVEQTCSESGVSMNRPKQRSVAQLRAALAADPPEWLKPAEVAALFGRTRWVAIGWMKAKKIRYATDASGYRECNPVDVLRLLAEYDASRAAAQAEHEEADPAPKD